MDSPPETDRRAVTDVLHGDEIIDPYRWLEEETDEVAAWVDQQNDYADGFLHSATREPLSDRFEPLARVGTYHPVVVRGGRYFQRIEAPDEDHPVLSVRDSPEGDRRTLADPNGWDGAKSLTWYVPSNDGEHVAYGVTEGGDEQYDITVLDVETGETVAEIDDAGRAGGHMLAWDAEGFYYVATGDADEGGQLDKEIRYRALDGTEEVLADHTDQHVWPVPHTDRESGGLVLALNEMSGGTDLCVYDGEAFESVLAGDDTEFTPHVRDGRVYLRTDHDAPRGRVLSCSLDELRGGDADPGHLDPDALTEIVPERDGTLERIAVAADHLVAHHQHEAHSRLTVYDHDGDRERDLSLPENTAVHALTANPDAAEAFFLIQSFDRPPAVVRADLADGTTRVLDETEVAADAIDAESGLVVRQEWFDSTDGVEVPVFVCHREGLDLDGDNPAVLYGYGGFRNSLTPTFDRFRLPFLADGGVYAQVCARGGREFGEEWHEAAMFDEKQHTFDDFIGAAEHLVDRGYTDSDALAVLGGSNGGLSVGAVVTQRPDLFAAGIAAVPLLDMLRFHQFLLGESWTTEYGSADDAEAYEYLREYSPYHNIESRAYPAMLFTTAVGDTRVHPSHARKTTARMQANQTGDAPILLRTNDETGHGLGKPTSQLVDEQLDRWTFLADALGVDAAGSSD